MSRASTTTKPHGIMTVTTPNRITTHPGEVLAEEY